jgi:hypothetical protein
MAASIRKLVRNMRTIDTKDNLLREAMEALIRATNNLDPDCIFCGRDATPDGRRHGPECIVSRIRACLPNAKDQGADK